MSLTLADLRTATRRLIDETDSSNTSYGDPELNDYINKGVRRAAILMEWPRALYTVPTVTDQRYYTLPSAFLYLVEVKLAGIKLDMRDRADLELLHPEWENDDSGQPTDVFRAENSVIGLHKKPSSAYSSLTLQVEIIKVPATVSADADVPDIHDVLQDIVPFYAAGMAQFRAGNYAAAREMKREFKEGILDARPSVNKFSEEFVGFRWG